MHFKEKLDSKRIRGESLNTATRLGYEVNNSLPLLDEQLGLRPVGPVVERFLCLYVIVACAYGFDRKRAKIWMNGENVYPSLTSEERRYIENHDGDENAFKLQVEALWALFWALGIVETLDFGTCCPDNFILMLPNLKRSESSDAFRKNVSLQPLDKIASACDLAYCLHWAIHQAELNRQPLSGKVHPHVIIERRRALEWLLSEDEWNNVSLDT